MMEYTDDQATVGAIAEILARGVYRWWKSTGFQRNNALKRLDNSRNIQPCVHRKSRGQRRDSDD
jgi:hypothetical protein